MYGLGKKQKKCLLCLTGEKIRGASTKGTWHISNGGPRTPKGLWEKKPRSFYTKADQRRGKKWVSPMRRKVGGGGPVSAKKKVVND